MSCTCMHGAHSIFKMGVIKYLNGLTGIPTNSNLRKLTASHYNALITQMQMRTCQNMFLIVYLNENLRYCNENLPWSKQEPLIHPYMFW